MDIKFTDEQLQQVITKAIFDSLTTEQKEDLLKKAVSSLLQPRERSGYSSYSKKTQLQEAYELAAYQVASSLIAEEMKNDEVFKANVKKLYADASEKVFAGENYQKLVDKAASNIIDVLTNSR